MALSSGRWWLGQTPWQIACSVHQTQGLKCDTVFPIKDQNVLERPLQRKRAHLLQLGMIKTAKTSQSRLFTKRSQPGIDRLLKSASYFISRLTHLPQRLQRKIFEKRVCFLQRKTHPRFSSRMMRSTTLRISSAE